MSKYIKLHSQSLLSSGLVIFIAGFLSNLFHYLFHLACGQLLNPLQYAELETVISINVFFGLLFPTLSFLIINSTAGLKVTDYRQLFFHHLSKFKSYVIIFWLSSIILYFPISSILHLHYPTAYLIFSLEIITTFIITIYLSIFQSQLKFIHYAAVVVAQPLLKLALTSLFLRLGWGILGAVGAFVVADILTIVLTAFLTNQISNSQKNNQAIVYPSAAFSLSCFLANLGLVLIPITNVFVVRSYLSLSDSAYYSATSILGKVVLFVTSTIITISYPLFVKNQNSPKAVRSLSLTLAILLIASSLVTLLYHQFSTLIVNQIYGSYYQPVADLLTSYSVYLAAFSIISLITSFYLSQNNHLAIWSSIVPLSIQLITTLFLHQSPRLIIRASTLSLVITIIPFLLIPFITHEVKIKSLS